MRYRTRAKRPAKPAQSEQQTVVASPHCPKRFCDGSCHPSGYHLRPRPIKPATDIRFLHERLFPHIKETLTAFCRASEDAFCADPRRDPDYIPPRHPPRSSNSTLSGETGDFFSIASSYDLYGFGIREPDADEASSIPPIDNAECPSRSYEHSRALRVFRWLDGVSPRYEGSSTELRGRRCRSDDEEGREVRSFKRMKVGSAA